MKNKSLEITFTVGFAGFALSFSQGLTLWCTNRFKSQLLWLWPRVWGKFAVSSSNKGAVGQISSFCQPLFLDWGIRALINDNRVQKGNAILVDILAWLSDGFGTEVHQQVTNTLMWPAGSSSWWSYRSREEQGDGTGDEQVKYWSSCSDGEGSGCGESAGLHCSWGRHALLSHGNVGILLLYHHQQLPLSTYMWMFAIWC